MVPGDCAKAQEEDDTEHYLTTFEQLAVANQWPEEHWAVRLVPVLISEARGAFVSLAAVNTQDYWKVKEARRPAKYEIDRLRFRDACIKPGETLRELCNRL